MWSRWFSSARSVQPTVICAVGAAAEASRRLHAGLVISICDPGQRDKTRSLISRHWGGICELDFHDVEEAAPGLIPPRDDQILAAVRAAEDAVLSKAVVVHCETGGSRSAAIALLVTCVRLRKAGVSSRRIVPMAGRMVWQHRTLACPNRRIVEKGARLAGLDVAQALQLTWECRRAHQ